MSKLAVCVWVASVLLDSIGRLALKSAAVSSPIDSEWQRWKRMLRSPPLWAGIVCFCLEFIVWLALVSLIPLSQAILIGSINIVVVALAGRVIFRERLDAARISGIALIAIGVALAGTSA
jgi:drug/metabolite transporter (DMT)-like permease